MTTTTKSALSDAVFGALYGGALGTGIGAGLGALHADKGHRRTGAVRGGLAGMALGGLAMGHAGMEAAAPGTGSYQEYAQAQARAAENYARAKARFQAYGADARSARDPLGASAAVAHKPMVEHAPWLEGITSKRDAHAKFRALARMHYPDMGGTHAAMQDLNTQWASAQQHPDFQKLAFCYDHGRRAALARFGA